MRKTDISFLVADFLKITMVLTDICQDIYIINLLRRTDRYERVAAQAKQFGFPFVVTCAVDAKEIHNPTRLRDGEHALLLSYAKVINWAKSRNLDKILIFEDDFELVDEFNFRLNEFSYVPEDWDLVYLGGNHSHLGAGWKSPEKVNMFVNRLYSTYCAHSILVRNTMYDYILDGISKFDKPLDVIYCDLQQKFNAYGFSKTMCRQYDSESDIIGFNPEYNKKGIFD